MSDAELRRALLDTTIAAQREGLNRGASGNLSVRCGNGFLITPSGMAPTEQTADDMVWMDLDGNAKGTRKPSSEWRFHRDLYVARPEFNAVLHAHSTFATTLACLGRDIPPFHYMIAAAGGKTIRCAPYATFGTQELSDHALKAMEGRKACLLANHGLLAAEASLERALALAVEVESLCEQYCRAVQIGTPKLLSDAEMDVVLEKFKSYGQNAQKT
ncbi:MAG: class II aldolase/adducin family protein [Sulfurimicrobium sp.]|jgi:L-fuculose-phosphate aldolase|nr:class II aldolase/adducin family protein [Sulfurimicrobium sp.]MDP2963407.1 class II aldolase/adducin family protein [Sulfurimicrobium sp.]MDZ7656002.1 class II aldolase/adducin family protein [Sulfurimicrobium sp.]